MSDGTGIEWTDATWNPTVGCSIVSPGCTNCYAMRQAWRIEKMSVARDGDDRSRAARKYGGLTTVVNGNPVWTGEVRLAEAALTQPLRMKRPRRIFVNSMSDLFHEALPDAAIDRVFAVMALAPQHRFQVLTKRSRRMRDYMQRLHQESFGATLSRMAAAMPAPLPKFEMIIVPSPNVWLGVSVERQQEADERIPDLMATPASLRFLSCEPLLGPLDLSSALNVYHVQIGGDAPVAVKYTGAQSLPTPLRPCLDWVICGGESGPGARPMHPGWARSLRDQCQAAGVPFFFKQWGEFVAQHDFRDDFGCHDCRVGQVAWPNGTIGPGHRDTHGGLGALMSRVGKKRAGRRLDGREWNEFPDVEARP